MTFKSGEAEVKIGTKASSSSGEYNFQRSMSSGNAADSGLYRTQQTMFSRTKSADTVESVANFDVFSSQKKTNTQHIDPEIQPSFPFSKQKKTQAVKSVSLTDFLNKFRLGFSSTDKEESKTLTRIQMNETHSPDSRKLTICRFDEGPALVAIHSAPVKGIARMREKLLEYSQKGNLLAGWPLTANILDPIRVSIVCNGPTQILQVQS